VTWRGRQAGGAVAAAWLVLSSPAAAAPSPIVEELRQQIRHLSRPVFAYHYTTTTRLGGQDRAVVDRSVVRSYLARRIVRFWDLGVPTEPFEMAPGLYLAIDPVISRVFGGRSDSWALFEVVLPRGLRFLDARVSADPARVPRFSGRAREWLVSRGCDTDQPDYLLTTLESAACRRIAVETLVELNVDALLFDYSRIAYESCPGRPEGGFVVIRPQAIDPSEARLFTSVPPADAASVAAARRINQAFAEARRSGSIRLPPWPTLETSEPLAPFASWARDRLFGCGDHPEDPPTAARGADMVEQWRTLARSSSDARTHFNLAESLARLGRTAEAVSAYRKALALDPEHIEAMTALARIRAAADDPGLRDPSEAVELATRAVELVYYRPQAVGDWSKQWRIETSMTLARADAAAGNRERAAAYAIQSLETSRREDEDVPTPQTARTVAEARRLVELYAASASPREKSP
jgi:tetratricopeptide (TPR) repeat protein